MGVKVKERIPGSGVFWIFIDHNGRRKAKKVGSEAAAKKAKALIEARLVLGNSALPEAKPVSPTIEEYFKRFEKAYLDTAAVRDSSRRNYRSTFSHHILPELKSKRLDEITREDVQQLIGTLVRKNLAKDTIRLILANLSCFLNHAKEAGVVRDNPATRLSKFYKQTKRVHDKIEPLTAEEVLVFLQATIEHYPECYPLLLCGIHTGMRSGELAGLQWGDIDFHGKFLIVRRNIVHGKVNPTKTSKERRIDLSDDLLATLEGLLLTRKEKWLARGKNEIPEWVFCNQAGKPADMQNVKNRVFLRCLEKAKLRRIRFHDLRHTFASLLIQNSEPLAYVKDQLGHASIKMTVDVYGHLVPGANRQAMNRLPALNSGSKPKKMGKGVG